MSAHGIGARGRSQRAEKLEDFHKTLSPRPLDDPDEFAAFYRDEINQVRGRDVVIRLAPGLERAHGAAPYKALLMGHSGVGKSTELTRLIRKVEGKYRAIRVSAMTQLDPLSFRPFDVLLLMLGEVIERTARPVAEGGANSRAPDRLLQRVWEWFGYEKEIIERSTTSAAAAAAAMGFDASSWWAKFLGLSAILRGEMKYASVRREEVVKYRLDRLDDLIEASNALLQECNRLLAAATGSEWLFLWEDFDKEGIDRDRTEDLFVKYAKVLKELDCHLILNIPIALGYSEKALMLPVDQGDQFVLPDTMVFQRDHETPHTKGRRAVAAVLEARTDPSLFAEEQLERLVVASGGNLRDLFALTVASADNGILRGASPRGPITGEDVTPAIDDLRAAYERRLGTSAFDLQPSGGAEPITYEKKAERLKRIYSQDPRANVPDPVLYSLLRSRAVQEHDGKRCFSVHPLVVEILAAHGVIRRTRRPTGAARPSHARRRTR